MNNYQIHSWAINAVLMTFKAKNKYGHKVPDSCTLRLQSPFPKMGVLDLDSDRDFRVLNIDNGFIRNCEGELSDLISTCSDAEYMICNHENIFGTLSEHKKDADQTTHQHTLISPMVVYYH